MCNAHTNYDDDEDDEDDADFVIHGTCDTRVAILNLKQKPTILYTENVCVTDFYNIYTIHDTYLYAYSNQYQYNQ